MNGQNEESLLQYRVVMNDEQQYSILPAHRGNPLGWHDAGKSGSKTECLDYIEKVWTDMRPLSVRQESQNH
jgi:MbtH protein